jgi:hypothetical protein
MLCIEFMACASTTHAVACRLGEKYRTHPASFMDPGKQKMWYAGGAAVDQVWLRGMFRVLKPRAQLSMYA